MMHLLVAAVATGAVAPGVPAPGALHAQGMFLENLGQWDSEARYLMRLPNLDTWVTDDGIVYQFYQASVEPPTDLVDPSDIRARFESKSRVVGHAIRLRFLNSAGSATHRGEPSPTRYNYLVGKREKWARGVRAYPKAVIRDLYRGIDAVVYSDGGAPRYDLLLAPGADASVIRMRLEGENGISIAPNGQLSVGTIFGNVTLGNLKAYQVVDGKTVPVQAKFQLHRDGTVTFDVGKYDSDLPLVIDPIMRSRFIGGSHVDRAVVVDTIGVNRMVAGDTFSANFPASGIFQYSGVWDAYVMQWEEPWTNGVVWATFLGSPSDDFIANGMGFQPTTDGVNVWVAFTVGNISATDWDVSVGERGGSDIVVVEILFDGSDVEGDVGVGSLGNDVVTAMGMFVDSADVPHIHLAGYTQGADFPVGAIDPFLLGYGGGIRDGFAIRVNPEADQLEYGGFLGGNQDDIATSLKIQSISGLASTVVVGGRTGSASFPHGGNSWGGNYNGGNDGFVARISFNPQNPFDPIAHLTHSTFVGGSGLDEVRSLAVTSGGTVFVTGRTSSPNFPTTSGAIDTTYNGGNSDVFVVSLNASFTSANYSTYLGGADFDVGNALVLGGGNTAIIGGETYSAGFPVSTNADDGSHNGQSDAFIVRLSAAGDALLFGSFYGGAGTDATLGLFSLGGTAVAAVGTTRSPSFPTTEGPGFAGSADAFMMDVNTPSGTVVLTELRIEPNEGVGGSFTATGTVTLSGPAGAPTNIILSSDNTYAIPPPSVTIPAGASEATFPITTLNPPSRQIATISANLGVTIKNATLTLNPNVLIGLDLAEPALTGGATGTGIVKLLAPAPPGGIVVTLNTSTPAVVIPPSVTVPVGQTSAMFSFPTHSAFTATIEAVLNSFNQKAEIIILPPVVFSTTVTPRVVTGGNSATFRVFLSGAAPPGGYLVRLISSHPNVASMPASVIVPAGSTFVDVLVTTARVQSAVDVTLSADRITRRSSILRVTPP
ncbi:MAG: hypothetical protein C4341_02810 [Armatimonadota bacterium]